MTKHYYHITHNNRWGETVLLKPKTKGIFRCHNEPKVPRICVAPSIEQCLIAVARAFRDRNYLYIYKTVNKVKGRLPFGVWDYSVTGETWLTRPTKFERIGRIKVDDLYAGLLWLPVGGETSEQKHMLKFIKDYKKSYVKFD